MMTLTVRAAVPSDGGAVARAWQRVGAYYTELDPQHFQMPTEEGLADSFEEAFGLGGPRLLQLVAELDETVMGWVHARLVPSEDDAATQFVREHGWTLLAIDALIVDPEAWRRGVGQALLDAAEAWGRERGAEVARLDTYAESPVSVPFYEVMGYERRSITYQKRL